MRIKEHLFIALCGITLATGAANAQVIVHAGPPPAVVVERPGSPLHPGWVWMPGYYRWNGRRYIWVGGYWAKPPRPRAVWIPGGGSLAAEAMSTSPDTGVNCALSGAA
jgi:WXXGXW repeat (2 copies)